MKSATRIFARNKATRMLTMDEIQSVRGGSDHKKIGEPDPWNTNPTYTNDPTCPYSSGCPLVDDCGLEETGPII